MSQFANSCWTTQSTYDKKTNRISPAPEWRLWNQSPESMQQTNTTTSPSLPTYGRNWWILQETLNNWSMTMLLAAAVLPTRPYEDAFKIYQVRQGAVSRPVCRWSSIAEPARPPVGCRSGLQSESHGLQPHSWCPKACSRLSPKKAGLFVVMLLPPQATHSLCHSGK